MNVDPSALIGLGEAAKPGLPSRSSTELITEFYDQAGDDYLHWSQGANMHFGFFHWGMNPFRRERMLNQFNLEIAARLDIEPQAKAFLIDLGCGVGATLRSMARSFPHASVNGVTIVPSQVRQARSLNQHENLHERIEVFCADYTSLPVSDRTADGVWAVESACYAAGAAKVELIREMARVLKPGARFVVADLFVTGQADQFNPLVRSAYYAACRNWAVPEMLSLDPFITALNRFGFTDICVENISWRVAPSVAHAPFAVLSFLLKKWIRGERLNQQSWNNLKASLLAPIIGVNRSKFCYCLISGRAGN